MGNKRRPKKLKIECFKCGDTGRVDSVHNLREMGIND